ncbi:MAG TPA: GNAT family N-acetyltransferase [Candidatus Copromorpha excrementipullorum]|uniref:GNAT family N-acetyltransferase n=1 Tax=Candidatus Allocopromorpha excrementipullorum TaxID=2840743 RepID=A0A9D1N6N6_9FIRM|nr:GNAT family N-acetyltransferase [Candidatus Copromorpha excrementipullorum]
MKTEVSGFEKSDIAGMVEIWNQVVEEGIAFPQMELLTPETAADFFGVQTWCGVARDEESGKIVGLYILHPNNVGRCGHICNTSYAVSSELRGKGIGRLLVEDSLEQAKAHGFRIMQFNAVVSTNAGARKLYKSLGFVPLGRIPGGFLMKDGHYEDIELYYHSL